MRAPKRCALSCTTNEVESHIEKEFSGRDMEKWDDSGLYLTMVFLAKLSRFELVRLEAFLFISTCF